VAPNVAIEHDTTIGSESSIFDSVIGPDCKIGYNVNIKDSYIWNNVVIEDNCSIDQSIIASNVIIRKDAIVEEGCIISKGVVIDSGKHLSSSTLLINDTDTISNEEAVGKNGLGDFYSDNEPDNLDWSSEVKEIEDDASSVSTSFSDSSDDRSESPVYDEFNCKIFVAPLLNRETKSLF